MEDRLQQWNASRNNNSPSPLLYFCQLVGSDCETGETRRTGITVEVREASGLAADREPCAIKWSLQGLGT